MTKHVVFDFDGTIADSLPSLIGLGKELAAKHGFKEMTEEDFKKLNTLTIKEKCKMMGIPIYKLPSLVLEVLDNYPRLMGSIKMINGIRDVICELKNKGYSLGIISSNSVSNITQFLDNNGIHVFNNVYSSRGLFGKHRTIKSFMKKFDVKRENIIYIGDELRDIESCKKLKVKIIAVSWGFDPTELLSKGNPDFIANHPNELLDLLDTAYS